MSHVYSEIGDVTKLFSHPLSNNSLDVFILLYVKIIAPFSYKKSDWKENITFFPAWLTVFTNFYSTRGSLASWTFSFTSCAPSLTLSPAFPNAALAFSVCFEAKSPVADAASDN